MPLDMEDEEYDILMEHHRSAIPDTVARFALGGGDPAGLASKNHRWHKSTNAPARDLMTDRGCVKQATWQYHNRFLTLGLMSDGRVEAIVSINQRQTYHTLDLFKEGWAVVTYHTPAQVKLTAKT